MRTDDDSSQRGSIYALRYSVCIIEYISFVVQISVDTIDSTIPYPYSITVLYRIIHLSYRIHYVML